MCYRQHKLRRARPFSEERAAGEESVLGGERPVSTAAVLSSGGDIGQKDEQLPEVGIGRVVGQGAKGFEVDVIEGFHGLI